MQVGDIGILQNLERNRVCSHLNGTTAVIDEIVRKGDGIEIHGVDYYIDENCYLVDLITGGYMLVLPENIRPLSDPDEEKTRETEREVVA